MPASAISVNDVSLTRKVVSLRDLKSVRRDSLGKKTEVFELEGQHLTPDQRFFDSVYSRFGINGRFFNYFSEAEVFDRIMEVNEVENIQVTLDETDDKNPILLSISAPDKELPEFGDIVRVLKANGIDINNFRADMPVSKAQDSLVITQGDLGGNGFIKKRQGDNIVAESAFSAPGQHDLTSMLTLPQVTYSRGVMRVLADPRAGAGIEINGDKFNGKYAIDIPLDGYGSPSIYIAMLRLVCMNLSIGLTKAFKSTIGLGKDKDYVEAVQRALEGFNDDEGYDIIRGKIEVMAGSWASVNECDTAYKILTNMSNKGFFRMPDGSDLVTADTGDDSDFNFMSNPILRKFREMLGNLTQDYGLAHMDAVSTRRKQCLPTACSLYDLMNFMTEVSTHWSNVEGQRRMQGYVGNLLSTDSYDLEGSKKEHSDYKELFLSDKKVANAARGLGKIVGNQ